MEFTASWRPRESSFAAARPCLWSQMQLVDGSVEVAARADDPYIGPPLCALNHDFSDFMPYK
jgi:hypothetical protein